MTRRRRVVQWATGNVGRASLRAILGRDDLELVGLIVHDAAKAGRDAGELAGVEPCGVLATTDVDAVTALGADCVAYMPLPAAQVGDDADLDHRTIEGLLASGSNVVTTVGYVWPGAYGPEVVSRLDDACRAGGSTLHGTGLNPGFMGDLVPLVLTSLCASVERVHIRESTDFSFYPSPEIVLGVMGMGRRPDDYEREGQRYRTWLSGLFAESVHLVAAGLGANLDEVTTEAEVRLAQEPVTIAAGHIAAGTVAAQRWTWTGWSGGRPRVVSEAVYLAHADAAADDWPPVGWRVKIDGRPNVAIDQPFHWQDNGLVATAMRAVNAIPAVCDAAPGIATLLDLPLVTPRVSWGWDTVSG